MTSVATSFTDDKPPSISNSTLTHYDHICKSIGGEGFGGFALWKLGHAEGLMQQVSTYVFYLNHDEQRQLLATT